MVIAVVGAIALGELTEAAAVVVLFSLSDFLESRCSGQVGGRRCLLLFSGPVPRAAGAERALAAGSAGHVPRKGSPSLSARSAFSLQARDAITAVLSIRPETAVLAASGRDVPAESVAVGSLILVKPGAKVPLDGRVEAGASSLDESMLTGGLRDWKRCLHGGAGCATGGSKSLGSFGPQCRRTDLHAQAQIGTGEQES